jgi:hypothetical protein
MMHLDDFKHLALTSILRLRPDISLAIYAAASIMQQHHEPRSSKEKLKDFKSTGRIPIPETQHSRYITITGLSETINPNKPMKSASIQQTNGKNQTTPMSSSGKPSHKFPT